MNLELFVRGKDGGNFCWSFFGGNLEGNFVGEIIFGEGCGCFSLGFYVLLWNYFVCY